MKQDFQSQQVRIEKLVHGGQGLGELADGRKVFVWNALPGELVAARIIKQKRSYAEAIAETIIEPSSERIEPQEPNYLATSPWQIMSIATENQAKAEIVQELFVQAAVQIPSASLQLDTSDEASSYHYRNKMEYSFWGDEQGIHLALHQRGSHGKQIVTGSQLALPAIDDAANSLLPQLNSLDLRAGDLKTIIVRANQSGEAVAALYVKPETFAELTLPPELKGLRVYHSNPKSPASVPTRLLQELGNGFLTDMLLGQSFTYDVDSFFQVNPPVFERALARIKQHSTGPTVTDMYAGVGSIGLSVAEQSVQLVELDPATAAMARHNAEASRLNVTVVEASTEQALDYITVDQPVIFDPPRAGLHQKVINRVLEVGPEQVIYLSCNPATQARDLALLAAEYEIIDFAVYNFFPRTPHIESLAVLHKR